MLAAGGSTVSFPILTALVLTPVLGAFIVALIGPKRTDLAKLFGLLASVVTGAMSVWMAVSFDTGVEYLQSFITPEALRVNYDAGLTAAFGRHSEGEKWRRRDGAL